MRTAVIIANLLVLLTFVVAGVLHDADADLYYRSVQEDEFLEWATFWGFVVAAYYYSAGAVQQFRQARNLPWFVAGLALFCFLVAMEEISWGQRLLGYRAPEYFLQENFQQEFNLHNVVDTSYRKLIMGIILLGYGVVLSALSLAAPVRKFLQRWRIVAPPPQLIVSFLAMFVVYSWYPWGHTGEWVEFTMALGFIFSAVLGRVADAGGAVLSPTWQVLLPLVIIAVLAAVTTVVVRYDRSADPAVIAAARREVAALSRDIGSGRVRTRCGIHKRLYTFMQKYRQSYLLRGEFARLTRASDAGNRGEYLLDPWNSAYWLRHKCADGKVALFVYSFGPNRRRDSTDWEIRGDDVGAYLIGQP